MFVTDDEINKRLSNGANLANRTKAEPRRTLTDYSERQEIRHETPTAEEDNTTIVPIHNGGRRPGDNNIPESLRGVIGAVARLDTIENTAEAFGVSKHHVFELKHGMNSTAQGKDDRLVDSINNKLSTPHDIAVQKLTEALTGINISQMTKQKDIVSAASALSRITEQTSPIKKDDPENQGARLVVYAPTIKQENHYESVHTDRAVN